MWQQELIVIPAREIWHRVSAGLLMACVSDDRSRAGTVVEVVEVGS